MKLYQILVDTLKKEPNFITDNGELKKWVVIHKAENLDDELLELLLSEPILKEKFFKKVKDVFVFNQSLFIQFLEQKNYFNNSYTKYKNKVGLTINGKYLNQRNEVVLVWPFKDCVLEGGQTKEEQKREEIFFNEILAQDEINQLFEPKVLTNAKRYTKDGVQPFDKFNRDSEINKKRGLPDDTITDNLIIKGNNLLALHSLKKEFAGKVKLIYIDPPYNTGSDSFNYNDRFNHSTWLTFMRNRLVEAKNLLHKDGAIFISINHIELGYLLILLDEIFGKENKLPLITLKAGTTASYRSINDCPVNVTEYIVAYSKSKDFKPNPVYRETGYSEDYSHYIINKDAPPSEWNLRKITDIIHEKFGCDNWRKFKKMFGAIWKKKRFDEMEKFAFENKESVVSLNTLQKPSNKIREIIQKSKQNRNSIFVVEREDKENIYCYNGRTLAFFSSKFREIDGEYVPAEILTNLWSDISFLGIGPEGGVTLENGKKPEYLLKTIIELITDSNDIVLDYHLGTGTTAAVAHKMGRQYIGIEQLDYGENDSVARLQNVINGDQTGISQYEDINWQGGGSFIYFELKKYNEAFIDKIQEAKTTDELLQIWEQMKDRSFLNYNVDIKKNDEHIEEFKQLTIKEQKEHLVELLNKNQLYVNLSSIDDKDFEVTEEEKKVTNDFYQINKG